MCWRQGSAPSCYAFSSCWEEDHRASHNYNCHKVLIATRLELNRNWHTLNLTIIHSAIPQMPHPEDANVFEFHKATKSVLKMGFYEAHSVKLSSSIKRRCKSSSAGGYCTDFFRNFSSLLFVFRLRDVTRDDSQRWFLVQLSCELQVDASIVHGCVEQAFTPCKQGQKNFQRQRITPKFVSAIFHATPFENEPFLLSLLC